MNVAYVRCSTDTQDVTHQVNTIKNYCRNNKIELSDEDIIKDEGISAYSTSYKDRKINDIIKSPKKIENLIIFEPSRLSRDFYEGQEIVKYLTMRNIKIHSAKDNNIINESDISMLMNSIIYFQANMESKNSSARIKSSKELQRQNYQYLGGRLTIGYKVENKKIVVNEEEVSIVKNMFNIYLMSSMSDVLKYLEENHIDRQLSNQNILQILRNKIFIGYPYNTDDTYIEELRIIDDITFHKVQKAIEDRNSSNRTGRIITAKSNNVLESLIYCACGRKMNIDYNRGVQNFRVRCKCKDHQKSFISERVIEIVENKLFEYLDNLDIELLKQKCIDKMKDKEKEEQKILADLKQNKSIKENLLNQFEKKMTQLLMLDGVDVSAINFISEKITEAKTEISKIETEIALRSRESHVESLEVDLGRITQLANFKSLYLKSDIKHKKMLMRTIIDKIDLYSYDNIKIHINI